MKIVSQRIIITAVSFIFLISLTVIGVKFLQGYRVDVNKKQLKLTGLLVVKSQPVAAQLFLDDKLSGATDASLSLPQGDYKVKLAKPGYQVWQKQIRVRNGLVTQIGATLWPISPDLSKVTYAGVLKPVLSPSRNEIAYVLPNSKAVNDWQLQPGIYILSLSSRGILNKKRSHLIAKDTLTVNFDKLKKLIWSPDGSKLMAILDNQVFLLSTANLQDNTPLLDVSYQKSNILNLWAKQKDIQLKAVFEKIKKPLAQELSRSSRVVDISPNDNILLYQATASAKLNRVIDPPLPDNGHFQDIRKLKKGDYYVYDIRDDKNYYLMAKSQVLPKTKLWWMADSRHILVINPGIISIIDLDGSNKTTIFTGKFDSGDVFPYASSQDIIVLTSLNPTQVKFYNLYNLSLR